MLAISTHTKYAAFAFVPTKQVFSHALAIVSSDEFGVLGTLCSSVYESWAFEYGSSLGHTLRYTPSDCFETFPFSTPDLSDLSIQFPTLNTIGETYYTHRQAVMRDRQEGLTKTYNRFHDANERASDIQKLRSLHIEMDQAVAIAYGWQDLDLGHGFHKTKQGNRFTISETARREVLEREARCKHRLLELNHQRYAEGVTQSIHDKGKKRSKATGKKSKIKANPKQGELF